MIVSYLGTHPVHKALYKSIEDFGIEMEDQKIFEIVLGKSYVNIKKLRDAKAYLTPSPLIAPYSLYYLYKKKSTIMVEEWWDKGRVRDRIIGQFLKTVYSHPYSIPVTLTRRVKQSLTHTIYIPPAKSKVDAKEKDGSIVTIARSHPIKNLELLVDIAKRIKDRKFVLITRVDNKQYFDKILSMAKGIDNLKILTDLSEEEKFQILSRANLLLHTALEGSIEFVIIEALSCSTPVVTYKDIGLAPELPDHWVVKENKLERWIETIENINDQDIRLAEEMFKNYDIEGKNYKEGVKLLRQRLESLLV